ncbi:hypothetical protein MRB53_034377 [Persea americana]|uniref:Uncharacterized protein n=1 Tax=Persea americana TaxID=3435 RepID=A0ACC2KYD9_PERAE|nr:hypothetical protein MRB53_034377 [Persea americana]
MDTKVNLQLLLSLQYPTYDDAMDQYPTCEDAMVDPSDPVRSPLRVEPAISSIMNSSFQLLMMINVRRGCCMTGVTVLPFQRVAQAQVMKHETLICLMMSLLPVRKVDSLHRGY